MRIYYVGVHRNVQEGPSLRRVLRERELSILTAYNWIHERMGKKPDPWTFAILTAAEKGSSVDLLRRRQ